MPCFCPTFDRQRNGFAQASFMTDDVARKVFYKRLASFLLKVFCFQKFQRSAKQIAEACNKMRYWDNFKERDRTLFLFEIANK